MRLLPLRLLLAMTGNGFFEIASRESKRKLSQSTPLLIAGDLLVLAAIVIIGFISHGEADMAFVARALATYVPLAGSWLCIAALLGLFKPGIRPDARYHGRVLIGAFVGAAAAVFVRSWMLGTPVQLPFLLVLAVMSALGLLIWRCLFAAI